MFASAATLLCLASLWMLQRSVDETDYHSLQERVDDVQAFLSHEDPDRSPQQVNDDFAAIYRFKDDGKYLQLRDDQGNWIFRSKRMIAANPDMPPSQILPKGGKVTEFFQGIHRVRILTHPIAVHGKMLTVQTGIALDKSIVLLANFRADLLLLTPIVILLAAAGGHAMSSKALVPVAALTAEARLINDRNLDIRLPVPKSEDEISDLAQTLNQMLERIDRSFASVRAFTGNASHELRTPIALMRTEIEVALHRPRTGEEYRKTLLQVHDVTGRATDLVENLLSLARTDAGTEPVCFAPTRLLSLGQEMERQWMGPMNQAMIEFTIETPGDDCAALCDEKSIRRLLSILLENASKYTMRGGSVRLRAEVQGERIALFVADTGIGIDAAHISRIFERFYRATPDAGLIRPGSGLGLALAKWIAERHGTELTVESTVGRGSCFSFSLERAYVSARDMETQISSFAR
jgi:signal transduction histidine kinase